MLFGEEFGGSDTDALSYCLTIEELSRVDMSLALVMWVGVEGARTMSHARPEQVEAWRERFILPTVRGELVSGGAITEPDAGQILIDVSWRPGKARLLTEVAGILHLKVFELDPPS